MEYWYVFPVAVLVSVIANASGFSGSVLFQPFFNFVLQVPISQSIATGIATETVGMTGGAYRYCRMRQIDYATIRKVFPFVFAGILSGIYLFFNFQIVLRFVVGAVIFSVAASQLWFVWKGRYGKEQRADLDQIGSTQNRIKQYLAGAFSACTGTGVAEIHQPMFEHSGGLATKRANASAILIEAIADCLISLVNLSVGNIRFDILIFSATGVVIGSQIGAIISPKLPNSILKTVFSVSVSVIGLVYIVTAVIKLI